MLSHYFENWSRVLQRAVTLLQSVAELVVPAAPVLGSQLSRAVLSVSPSSDTYVCVHHTRRQSVNH